MIYLTLDYIHGGTSMPFDTLEEAFAFLAGEIEDEALGGVRLDFGRGVAKMTVSRRRELEDDAMEQLDILASLPACRPQAG